MVVQVVFFVGRPGSGKSTAIRHIMAQLQENKNMCEVVRINDYDILYKIARHDMSGRFRLTDNKGFDALDENVYNEVLPVIEDQAKKQREDTLVFIEFARDEYRTAFSMFHPDFLRSAHVLYSETNIDTCLQRIHTRVAHPSCADDHPSCSDSLFRSRFTLDSSRYIESELKTQKQIEGRVEVIENKESLQHFFEKVDTFFASIIPNFAQAHTTV